MDNNTNPPYRTVGTVIILALTLLVALLLCLRAGTDFAAKMYDTTAYTILGLATVLVMKRVGEAAAQGTGIRGMLNTLLTDAKPGESAPAVEVAK